MYILLIVAITGNIISKDVRFTSFELNNRNSCYRVAEEAASRSTSQIGYICISKETGESKIFKGKE